MGSSSNYNLDSVLTAWSGGKDYVRSALWDSWQWVEDNKNRTLSGSKTVEVPAHVTNSLQNLESEVMSGPLVRSGSAFIRFAGLSGAAAVALGAYGAHSFGPEKAEYKKVYDTANFYHFIHTMALMAVPLSRRPVVTGTLLISGMTIFCGTIYYHALTEEKSLRKFTPTGGVLLILAWASMLL